MRNGRSPSLPLNRRLRRTVAGLLLTVPSLSLTACEGEDDGGCIPYGPSEAYRTSFELLPDGSQPTNANCMTLCQAMNLPDLQRCDVTLVETHLVDGGTGQRTDTRCHYIAPGGCRSDGRHPEGLLAGRVESRSALGALFAEMAWLEAASVPAFLRLAEELKAHGAPEALIRAARRSAGDEVRHQRAMEALARHHGASVSAAEVAPFSARSLEAMVTENAREGCVREMYGAVVVGWQARTAGDARVREELGRIAEDELRHAELAWAVDAWAAERLSPEELRRVREARVEAFQELTRLVEQEEPEAVLVEQAGLPSRGDARRLLQGLQVLVA
ncbi:hypothetical protein [Pyxidicoccus caerfyrddinensis]|uniref:hypothetical protein n=1 Tax=Pyxidicoccus caerfyrddinensis TaxID=2709663 RepID=UPI0013D9C78F|nr:hypothetical protein [Pyxidicoccus caerfyrddinensis]